MAGTKTAGDSPNGARLSPQLRKAASPLSAIGRAIAGKGKSNQTRSDFGFPGLQRDLLKNRVFHKLTACKTWSKLRKKNEKSKFFQDMAQNQTAFAYFYTGLNIINRGFM